uniref:CS domain-containing protein n=1 Tax=Clastoptera arizonana TaxID=38151 RepID=A0A1B6C3D0_9HEMI
MAEYKETKVFSGSSDPTNEVLKMRYEWYQTNSQITLMVFENNVKEDSLILHVRPSSLYVNITTNSDEIKVLDIKLAHKIEPNNYSIKFYPKKIEVKLQKVKTDVQWTSIEKEQHSTCNISSASNIRNWDKVVETELKDENSDSEELLNELFQNIYTQGSDEVKKAMNKSFVESGGTVLSTNWNEVGKEKVEMRPPDGLEFKTWD